MTAKLPPGLFKTLLLALAATGVASGANFELITQDTYLSPTVLRSAMGNTPTGAQKVMFWTNSLTTGVENHYQYRDDYDDSTNFVGGLTSDFYVKNFQVEISYTGRGVLETGGNHDSPVVPAHRYKAAIGYYWPLSSRQPTLAPSQTGARKTGSSEMRFLLGWTGDRRRDGRFVGELYFDASLRLLPAFVKEHVKVLKEFSGSYLYSWRPATSEHFLGYAFHTGLFRWSGGSRLNYNVSVGAAKRNHEWDWGAVQHYVVFAYAGPTPDISIEFGCGLTRDIDEGRWHHQFAIATKYDVFSKIVRNAR